MRNLIKAVITLGLLGVLSVGALAALRATGSTSSNDTLIVGLTAFLIAIIALPSFWGGYTSTHKQ